MGLGSMGSCPGPGPHWQVSGLPGASMKGGPLLLLLLQLVLPGPSVLCLLYLLCPGLAKALPGASQMLCSTGCDKPGDVGLRDLKEEFIGMVNLVCSVGACFSEWDIALKL